MLKEVDEKARYKSIDKDVTANEVDDIEEEAR
jgi:hypothetical protein